MKDLSVDRTGILWIDPHIQPVDDHIFNKPWMKAIDQELLYRYWKKKGCPGYLYTYMAGAKVWHRYLEDVGIVSAVAMPKFDQL